MFYDLSISQRSTKESDRESIVRRSIELGYSCIAWNTTVNGKSNQQVKVPKLVAFDKRLLDDACSNRRLVDVAPVKSASDFKQFTHVTVIVDDASDAQSLTTGNAMLLNYDIVAASPRSLSSFTQLCRQAEVDIISLDFSRKLPFHIDQKHVAAAVKRGILFEISYSPLLQGSAPRRQLMEATSLLVEYLKGKYFILSSDSEGVAQMRGPHDVMNIGCIIGLPEEQARKSISDNCVLVLKHSYSRRLRYTGIEMLSRADFKNKWSHLDELVASTRGGDALAIAMPDLSQGKEVNESSESVNSSDDGGSDDDSIAAGLDELKQVTGIPSTSERGLEAESSDSDDTNVASSDENGSVSAVVSETSKAGGTPIVSGEVDEQDDSDSGDESDTELPVKSREQKRDRDDKDSRHSLSEDVIKFTEDSVPTNIAKARPSLATDKTATGLSYKNVKSGKKNEVKERRDSSNSSGPSRKKTRT